MPNASLGQYFTIDAGLKNCVMKFIKNDPSVILEPSIGRGDLIEATLDTGADFDMYEIDSSIEMLECVDKNKVIFGDFLQQEIIKRYQTIIANPPYVKTKSSNLYIDFIDRCYDLLEIDGEMIFIVPSDFLKLTSATKIINKLLSNGSFTHIYHPHNEKLFENATIDIFIFRYQKTESLEKVCVYNEEQKYILNINGTITFVDELEINPKSVSDYFNVYVGMVSGKDAVYKTNEFHNINILTGKNNIDKFIFLEQYPSDNDDINKYLKNHKAELINRKIKKFNESNWFQWGAPRNISTIRKQQSKPCIYMYNLTRNKEVAFYDKVQYFGGNLLMLVPKLDIDLTKAVNYFNGDQFKKNYTFAGRFKIGQRQLMNATFSE